MVAWEGHSVVECHMLKCSSMRVALQPHLPQSIDDTAFWIFLGIPPWLSRQTVSGDGCEVEFRPAQQVPCGEGVPLLIYHHQFCWVDILRDMLVSIQLVLRRQIVLPPLESVVQVKKDKTTAGVLNGEALQII